MVRSECGPHFRKDYRELSEYSQYIREIFISRVATRAQTHRVEGTKMARGAAWQDSVLTGHSSVNAVDIRQQRYLRKLVRELRRVEQLVARNL